jgi:hypothetical protein
MNDQTPLACSLPPADQAKRGRELDDLARRALVRSDRAGRELVLGYRAAPTVEEALRELIRREAECCPFLDLELVAARDELELRVSAPPGAEGVLDLIQEANDL